MKSERYFLYMIAFFIFSLLFFAPASVQAYEEDEEDILENNIILLDLSCPASAGEGEILKGWQSVSVDLEEEENWLQKPRPLKLKEEQTVDGCALIMAARNVWLSEALAVDENTLFLSGAVMASGSENMSVALIWSGEGEMVAKEDFRKISVQGGERFRFNLADASRPEEADAVRIALCNEDPEKDALWHSILLSTVVSYRPEIMVTASRIGYEPEWPKTFAVHGNFRASRAVFVLKDDTNKECFRGMLSPAENIQGFGDSVWPGYYYRGDFSDFQEEGVFTIDVELDDQPVISREIFIQYQLLWNRAFAPPLEAFKASRSRENQQEGRLSLWDEGGINPASQAELLWKLVRSWSLVRMRFAGHPVLVALEEEVRYGAEKAAASFLAQAAGELEDPDEANWYLNALTCIVRTGTASDAVTEAATLLWKQMLENGVEGPWMFYAALDLYAASGEEDYFHYAASTIPEITVDRVESLLDYESLSDFQVSGHLREIFSEKGKALFRSAENAYGLPQGVTTEEKGFFLENTEGDELHPRGNTLRVLAAAEVAAQTYRYTADKNFLRFVCDQFSWIWGNNPFDVQLVAEQR